MRLASLLTALWLGLLTGMAAAQSFNPVITVGDRAITGYEIDQRARLLTLFRAPGDPAEVAREQLIEDRLKQIALDRIGLRITPEALATEVEAFAARANLTAEQFAQVLAQNGVEFTTLEEFVRIGVSWRDFIRSQYGNRVNITEAEVDRAIGRAGGGADGIEVLLSEIIIPAPPPQAAQANAIAARIAQSTSQSQFSAFARQYSALPSRGNGGRLGWLPISNYPPQLQGLILGLGTNDVTPPIPITNGVALFQMRGVREVASAPPAPTAIDYATFYLPGGASEASLAAAQRLALQVDTCDDLYGAARDLPPEVLERDTVSPADIPQDVAIELARLDRGEVSYQITRGDNRLFLMLCDRQTGSADGTLDREAVRNQLRTQRLTGFANALLADIRASVVITQ